MLILASKFCDSCPWLMSQKSYNIVSMLACCLRARLASSGLKNSAKIANERSPAVESLNRTEKLHVCLFFSPGVFAVHVICVYACRHLWLSVHLFVCTCAPYPVSRQGFFLSQATWLPDSSSVPPEKSSVECRIFKYRMTWHAVTSSSSVYELIFMFMFLVFVKDFNLFFLDLIQNAVEKIN